MGRTNTKPFLKRKKVPKLYFHFCFPPPQKLNKFFPEMYSYLLSLQGLAVIFSHHHVCIKKKKGGHFFFGGGGSKSESRVSAPFFAAKMV
jgi:hypothetical protein